MVYDITERVQELKKYYDSVLDERIKRISEISGVDESHFVKINPADFIEKSPLQRIRGYKYQKIADWIERNKTDDKTFLISPLDKIEETAEQVAYKSAQETETKIRASKCDVLPMPTPAAQDFFIRNHRQTAPLIRKDAICYSLVYDGIVAAVMLYDISNGAVRGSNEKYELVRLAIKKNVRVYGGASKLQKACEEALKQMGVEEIYSYSNATINSGAVYTQLGFTGSKVAEGQPFVIMENNKLERLINLFPDSTDAKLVRRGRMKTHVSGNKTWIKRLE